MKLLNCPCCGSRRTMVMATVGRWACCSECGLSTKSFLTEQEAADAWNKRQSEWTAESPTEPGWYWWRLKKGVDPVVFRLIMAEWYDDSDDVILPECLCVFNDEMGEKPVDKYRGEWCRIPEPEES